MMRDTPSNKTSIFIATSPCRHRLWLVPVDVDAVVAAHIVIDGTSKCGVVITVPEIGNRFPEIH